MVFATATCALVVQKLCPNIAGACEYMPPSCGYKMNIIRQRCHLVCFLNCLALATILAASLVWQGATLHAQETALSMADHLRSRCEPDDCPPNPVDKHPMAAVAPNTRSKQTQTQRTGAPSSVSPAPEENRLFLPLMLQETEILIDRKRFFYEPAFDASQIQ